MSQPLWPQRFIQFLQGVPQIVPESWCANCKICCRFPDEAQVQAPVLSPQEVEWAKSVGAKENWFQAAAESPSQVPVLSSCVSGFQCPAFHSDDNRCTIYSARPLDCRIYPFVLTKESGATKAVLNMDLKCPYLQAHGQDSQVVSYSLTLAQYLESETGLAYLKTNPGILGPHWPEFIPVAALPKITAGLEKKPKAPHPLLKPLEMADETLLKEALKSSSHQHSGFTLTGLLGWKDLIHFWWMPWNGHFCLFAEQAGGLLMPIPPLIASPARFNPAVLDVCWEILTEVNQGEGVSRIEGVEPSWLALFEEKGFQLRPHSKEYLYSRQRVAQLKGKDFRSQRWAVNRASRSGKVGFRPFQPEDVIVCLQLYTQWAIRRQSQVLESYFRALIRDGLYFHRRLMMEAQRWGGVGRVLEVDGKIKGYTFGAAISPELFGVYAEITDQELPGSAQLIFQEFCRELTGYEWINVMSDEGLAGLKRAKQAYRPQGWAQTWSASRENNSI